MTATIWIETRSKQQKTNLHVLMYQGYMLVVSNKNIEKWIAVHNKVAVVYLVKAVNNQHRATVFFVLLLYNIYNARRYSFTFTE